MKLFILSFIILIQLYSISPYIIGVDLGTEFFKATILRPNRPFTMLENLQSKTKTPTSLAFKDDERLFGVDALSKKVRFPKQTLVFFHEYLSKNYNNEEIAKFIEEFFVSYDMEEDEERHTINIKINFNKNSYTFSIEEIFGMLFRYIKFLADKFSQTDIRDCVVTVPAFWGYVEREALSKAIQMSKLNLLGFVNENVAAAVQFSLDKRFNTTEYYIFYNMGSSFTQATLVSYLTKFETKNNKTIDNGKIINILQETWDRKLGGNNFNYNLVRHLMKRFDELPSRKGKPSVTKDYKVAERILPSAVKYKEMLSANKEVVMGILGVEGGINLEGKLTREEFEKVNEDLYERIYTPIEKLLNRTSITLDQISQIELIGGSVRIPKIQEILKSKVGNDSLIGQHMNGDDSMALGAAFLAANFSSNFKGGKKIELYHGANYELRVKLSHDSSAENICPDDQTELAFECTRKLVKNATVYKVRHGFDLARTVSLKHDSNFNIAVYQKFEHCDSEKLLISYNITGVPQVLLNMKNDNITTMPKVNMRFKIDSRGALSLKADIVYEMVLYLNSQIGPTGGVEFLYKPTFVEPLTEEEIKKIDEEIALKSKDTNSTKGADMMTQMRKEIGKKKTQENKNDLTVNINYAYKFLNKTDIENSNKKLDSLDEIDELRIRTMERRNSLETLIYNKREWLESKESQEFAKEKELQEVKDTLKKISEWYEDEGYAADFENLDKNLKELSDKFKDFDTRINVFKKRVNALERFSKNMNKTLSEASTLIKSKPWVEAFYNTTFTKEINLSKDWLKEMLEKQDKLAYHEEPVLTSELIDNRIKIIRREYYSMAGLPKPKPAASDINLDELKNNKTYLEELIRKANLSGFDFENMTNFDGANKTENDENANEEKPDL